MGAVNGYLPRTIGVTRVENRNTTNMLMRHGGIVTNKFMEMVLYIIPVSLKPLRSIWQTREGQI
jgi:hypothetical protein